MARLGADDRHVELDDLQFRDRAEHLFDRGHDPGQGGAFLQRDALRHRMHEQPPQIVEPLGEELRDRV